MIPQALLDILTTYDGQDLADHLGTYFNRTFTTKQAEANKKMICCSLLAIDTLIARQTDTNRALPSDEQYATAVDSALELETFAHDIE